MEVIKKLKGPGIIPVISGMIAGVALAIIADLAYIYIFHENSSEFYLFAGLALVGGPVAGGIIAALKAKAHRSVAMVISGGAVFMTITFLSLLSYVFLPVFFYDSVQIPVSGTGNAGSPGSHMPPYLNYTIPGIGTGTLVAADNNSAVIVLADYDRLPFTSTVYLVNKSNNTVLLSLKFNNDIIAAAIDQGELYLFNDKIGYIIDPDTGKFAKKIVTADNYRGAFTSGNNTYMQTTFEISILNPDGSVISHRNMYMNCTAFGYFISGPAGRVLEEGG